MKRTIFLKNCRPKNINGAPNMEHLSFIDRFETTLGMTIAKPITGNMEDLKDIYTAVKVNHDGTKVDIPMYKEMHIANCGYGKYLCIPRYSNPNVPPVPFNYAPLDVKSYIELRPEQSRIVRTFENARNSTHPYGGIIQAKTGVGKTVMGIHLACKYNMNTLIVVPMDHLMQQWKERILTMTDCTEDDIGIVRSDKCIFHGKKFVIAMIHSLVQREYETALYNDFGTTIWDECHTLGAETFSKAVMLFNDKIRIGLSATPRRKDGTERVFFEHIGPVLAKSEHLALKPKVLCVKYKGNDTGTTGCMWNGKLNLGRYHNRVSESYDRNHLILQYVVKAYEQGRNVLILTDRVGHVHNLRSRLINDPNVSGNIGICIGEKKDLNNKRIIVGTYGSTGMGVDIPELDTVIFATPRVDVEQAMGRILREQEDKKQPVVIDIVDIKVPLMQKWYYARRKHYKNAKAEIKGDFNG